MMTPGLVLLVALAHGVGLLVVGGLAFALGKTWMPRRRLRWRMAAAQGLVILGLAAFEAARPDPEPMFADVTGWFLFVPGWPLCTWNAVSAGQLVDLLDVPTPQPAGLLAVIWVPAALNVLTGAGQYYLAGVAAERAFGALPPVTRAAAGFDVVTRRPGPDPPDRTS